MGGLVGEVEGYLWMWRQRLGAAGKGGGELLRQWRQGVEQCQNGVLCVC